MSEQLSISSLISVQTVETVYICRLVSDCLRATECISTLKKWYVRRDLDIVGYVLKSIFFEKFGARLE